MAGPNLRDRAAGREVATPDSKRDLIAGMQRMQEQFQLAMPRGAEATQLVRDVVTLINSNEKLALCDRASLFGGVMTMAQLGLRPGVLGHGWLLPFYDRNANNRRGGYKAQLIIGYQGLVELAHRSGKVKSLIARTVHEHDDFDVEYGLDEKLQHRPARGDRGAPIGYYAVVKLTTGGHAFVDMTQQEMEAYRDRYAMAKNKAGEVIGPWRDQFESMAHKTTVRQLSKWMPKGTDLSTALAVDGTVRTDTAPQLSAAAPTISHPTPAVEAAPVSALEVGDPDVVADAELDDDSDDDGGFDPAGFDPDTGEVRDPPTGGAEWPETARPGER